MLTTHAIIIMALYFAKPAGYALREMYNNKFRH